MCNEDLFKSILDGTVIIESPSDRTVCKAQHDKAPVRVRRRLKKKTPMKLARGGTDVSSSTSPTSTSEGVPTCEPPPTPTTLECEGLLTRQGQDSGPPQDPTCNHQVPTQQASTEQQALLQAQAEQATPQKSTQQEMPQQTHLQEPRLKESNQQEMPQRTHLQEPTPQEVPWLVCLGIRSPRCIDHAGKPTQADALVDLVSDNETEKPRQPLSTPRPQVVVEVEESPLRPKPPMEPGVEDRKHQAAQVQTLQAPGKEQSFQRQDIEARL